MTRPPEASGDAPGYLPELIEEHRAALTAYALDLTSGDHATADDLVQETIVRAWRTISTVPRDADGSRRWLFIVAHRLFADEARRRQAQPSEVVGTLLEEDSAVMVVACDTLRAAASSLSSAQREALYEVFFVNRPIDEVARRLGVPEGTVRSRVHYALRHLRQSVTEVGPG